MPKIPDKIYLNESFEFFWKKLESGENFTLLRYNDGEYALCAGRPFNAASGWQVGEGMTKLGEALKISLSLVAPDVYYGISCPCCSEEAYNWYRTRLNTQNVTFATLWVNINYPKFKENFPKLTRDAVLVANHRAKGVKIANLNILKHYEIPDDCIGFWENGAQNLINMIENDFGARDNLLYVFSAGPLSEPVIYQLYKNNPNNCYIDFGSCIDAFYHDKPTRNYMRANSQTREKNCWMDNPVCFDPKIVAVCILKKNSGILPEQLSAIKNQTYKPKKIVLFVSEGMQIPDFSADYSQIVAYKDIQDIVVTLTELSKSGQIGQFVCILDDYAVPNIRYFENCCKSLEKQDGVYGGYGIILTPKSDIKINNLSSFSVPIEVDCLQHSFFFAVKHLDMLPKLLENAYSDIKKYVPPQPFSRKRNYGIDIAAAVNDDSGITQDTKKRALYVYNPDYPQSINKTLILEKKAHAKPIYRKIAGKMKRWLKAPL
jgi:hypothetical protein